MTPGIVLKSRFTVARSDVFEKYVEYIDRDKATRAKHFNDFSLYQDYMDNPFKTSSLFSSSKDSLDSEEKKQLKDVFKIAQNNGSVMWQDVISFNNDWLEKQGVYDSKTKTVDEQKIKDMTRSALSKMMKEERLENSAIWSAAIHYNTKHIHVHIAMVEPHPTRKIIMEGKHKGEYRGKRKPKTLQHTKSAIFNAIVDRSQEYKQIDQLIRKTIVQDKREFSSFNDEELKKMFLNVYQKLPSDRRQWYYAYHSLDSIRPEINQLSEYYVKTYHPDDYEQLMKVLDNGSATRREAFGEGKKERELYKNFKQTNIGDLYQRLGNAFLNEMRSYAKRSSKMRKKLSRLPTNHSIYRERSPDLKNDNRQQFIKGMSLNYALKKLDRNLSKELQNWKNMRAHEELEREIEQENQYWTREY